MICSYILSLLFLPTPESADRARRDDVARRRGCARNGQVLREWVHGRGGGQQGQDPQGACCAAVLVGGGDDDGGIATQQWENP